LTLKGPIGRGDRRTAAGRRSLPVQAGGLGDSEKHRARGQDLPRLLKLPRELPPRPAHSLLGAALCVAVALLVLTPPLKGCLGLYSPGLAVARSDDRCSPRRSRKAERNLSGTKRPTIPIVENWARQLSMEVKGGRKLSVSSGRGAGIRNDRAGQFRVASENPESPGECLSRIHRKPGNSENRARKNREFRVSSLSARNCAMEENPAEINSWAWKKLCSKFPACKSLILRIHERPNLAGRKSVLFLPAINYFSREFLSTEINS
jgi:hypothetical protein